MSKEELLQDWLPRLWDALRDVRHNNNAAAEEAMYELYVEMKQQTLAEKMSTFSEITLEDQLSAMAIELLDARKRMADLDLQICQRHFEANHIPDATKMVEPVVVMTREASLCSPKFAEQLKSGDVFKLYTTPQQRTWVGLTDEEFEAIWKRFGCYELMREIEAKLKEKNT